MIKAEIKRNNDMCKCDITLDGSIRDIEMETSVFVESIVNDLANKANVDESIIAGSIISKILIQIVGKKNEVNRNK